MTEDEVFDAVMVRVAMGRMTDSPESRVQAPASAEALDEAERVIGYPFPPLIRRLYGEVANGGFGPFGGVEGVGGGHESAGGAGMLAEYVEWRDTEIPDDSDFPAWMPGVVFFCDFGCAMWALLDCRVPGGRIMFLDQGELHELDVTPAQWFELWLDGELDMHKLAAA
ncbi:SMI1/KNR4 family protein [Actinoplanes sp. Pm04-4]|uniref:SMI1/KNR4 family protein n=1 Tax=Paractinoplanes pyxinae TaxID=2997416 RepID=A0ABT4ARS6_9ACTN|nr:SMI1/KNR4 family protein [Actinoplanes pyxinae]MCY1136942.1 SMI1/KNR4 family protein [Actinoplanes pyxinae]